MLILALDTALAACSAAIIRDGETLASREIPMTRGHAEALAPLVAELANEANIAMAELDRIAVTVGPGTFTGLRVGIAFARGLGLALAAPVIGISTTEAVAKAIGAPLSVGIHAAALDDIYIEAYRDNEVVIPPSTMALTEAAELVESLGGAPVLAGTAANRLAALVPGAIVFDQPLPNPVVIATLAAGRDPANAPPSPLYLRPPHITQPKPK
jgi:tRNA threonylcarbamoyladenosine biosynthesis protein TsaB